MLRTLCVYFLALDVFLSTALSLARGLLVDVSCTAAVSVITGICCASLILLLVLRPLPSLVKNVVAIFLASCNATASVVLLVGVGTASIPTISLSMTLAAWAATASTAGVVVSVISTLLHSTMNDRSHRLKKAALMASSSAPSSSSLVPMLQVTQPHDPIAEAAPGGGGAQSPPTPLSYSFVSSAGNRSFDSTKMAAIPPNFSRSFDSTTVLGGAHGATAHIILPPPPSTPVREPPPRSLGAGGSPLDDGTPPKLQITPPRDNPLDRSPARE